MRPVGTVQLPVAKFALLVRDFDSDAELGLWIRKFAKALAYTDPSINDFAAELLVNVDEFRTAKADAMRDSRRNKKVQDADTSETITVDGEIINNKTKVPLPQDIGEVYSFGAMKKISESTCHQFWEINSKNNWQFKGKIRNWMGALIQFSKTDQA